MSPTNQDPHRPFDVLQELVPEALRVLVEELSQTTFQHSIIYLHLPIGLRVVRGSPLVLNLEGRQQLGELPLELQPIICSNELRHSVLCDHVCV